MSNVYGLIGKKLSHSFSKKYFTEKFTKEGLAKTHRYELFELSSVDQLPELIKNNPDLKGLNVTIPYKTEVISYLYKTDIAAQDIGAVNTIKITAKGLAGYNSDTYGFERSLFENIEKESVKQALILGSGGASKAVQFVLKKNYIPYTTISRSSTGKTLDFNELNVRSDLFQNSQLIINTTPLGMHPNINDKPPIPYHLVNENHIFFDLVYNPERTSFLKEGAARGVKIVNGLDMLYYQAERAWKIWNDPNI